MQQSEVRPDGEETLTEESLCVHTHEGHMLEWCCVEAKMDKAPGSSPKLNCFNYS